MQVRHTDGGALCLTILMVSLPISDEIGCLTKPYSSSRLSRPLTSYLLTLQKVYSIPLPKEVHQFPNENTCKTIFYYNHNLPTYNFLFVLDTTFAFMDQLFGRIHVAMNKSLHNSWLHVRPLETTFVWKRIPFSMLWYLWNHVRH